MKIVKSIDKYMKVYFPKQYKKEKLAKMTPAELGEHLAKKLLKDIK